MKKITRTIVVVTLIVLGLAALLTPLSPGSWLILIGLEYLGLRILLRNKLLAWAAAHPNRRFARVLCRILYVGKRNRQARAKCREQRGS